MMVKEIILDKFTVKKLKNESKYRQPEIIF